MYTRGGGKLLRERERKYQNARSRSNSHHCDDLNTSTEGSLDSTPSPTPPKLLLPKLSVQSGKATQVNRSYNMMAVPVEYHSHSDGEDPSNDESFCAVTSSRPSLLTVPVDTTSPQQMSLSLPSGPPPYKSNAIGVSCDASAMSCDTSTVSCDGTLLREPASTKRTLSPSREPNCLQATSSLLHYQDQPRGSLTSSSQFVRSTMPTSPSGATSSVISSLPALPTFQVLKDANRGNGRGRERGIGRGDKLLRVLKLSGVNLVPQLPSDQVVKSPTDTELQLSSQNGSVLNLKLANSHTVVSSNDELCCAVTSSVPSVDATSPQQTSTSLQSGPPPFKSDAIGVSCDASAMSCDTSTVSCDGTLLREPTSTKPTSLSASHEPNYLEATASSSLLHHQDQPRGSLASSSELEWSTIPTSPSRAAPDPQEVSSSVISSLPVDLPTFHKDAHRGNGRGRGRGIGRGGDLLRHLGVSGVDPQEVSSSVISSLPVDLPTFHKDAHRGNGRGRGQGIVRGCEFLGLLELSGADLVPQLPSDQVVKSLTDTELQPSSRNGSVKSASPDQSPSPFLMVSSSPVISPPNDTSLNSGPWAEETPNNSLLNSGEKVTSVSSEYGCISSTPYKMCSRPNTFGRGLLLHTPDISSEYGSKMGLRPNTFGRGLLLHTPDISSEYGSTPYKMGSSGRGQLFQVTPTPSSHCLPSSPNSEQQLQFDNALEDLPGLSSFVDTTVPPRRSSLPSGIGRGQLVRVLPTSPTHGYSLEDVPVISESVSSFVSSTVSPRTNSSNELIQLTSTPPLHSFPTSSSSQQLQLKNTLEDLPESVSSFVRDTVPPRTNSGQFEDTLSCLSSFINITVPPMTKVTPTPSHDTCAPSLSSSVAMDDTSLGSTKPVPVTTPALDRVDTKALASLSNLSPLSSTCAATKRKMSSKRIIIAAIFPSQPPSASTTRPETFVSPSTLSGNSAVVTEALSDKYASSTLPFPLNHHISLPAKTTALSSVFTTLPPHTTESPTTTTEATTPSILAPLPTEARSPSTETTILPPITTEAKSPSTETTILPPITTEAKSPSTETILPPITKSPSTETTAPPPITTDPSTPITTEPTTESASPSILLPITTAPPILPAITTAPSIFPTITTEVTAPSILPAITTVPSILTTPPSILPAITTVPTILTTTPSILPALTTEATAPPIIPELTTEATASSVLPEATASSSIVPVLTLEAEAISTREPSSTLPGAASSEPLAVLPVKPIAMVSSSSGDEFDEERTNMGGRSKDEVEQRIATLQRSNHCKQIELKKLQSKCEAMTREFAAEIQDMEEEDNHVLEMDSIHCVPSCRIKAFDDLLRLNARAVTATEKIKISEEIRDDFKKRSHVKLGTNKLAKMELDLVLLEDDVKEKVAAEKANLNLLQGKLDFYINDVS